jgi:hypothetical protein
MPWEITIRRADGAPLGDLATVRQQFATVVPAVQFYSEPSGPEKIAAARALGVEFPDVIRKHIEQLPATEKADYEGDGFSVRFYGFDAQPLIAVCAEVRGSGNPLPFLTALCRTKEWVVIDDTSGQPVELGGAAAEGWKAFLAYRDRVIQGIQASGGEKPP